MGIVGVLGDIPFFVSHSAVMTLNNLTVSGSARYSTHQRHAQRALTELTGFDPDKVTFDVELSVYLGVSPISSIGLFQKYLRSSEVVPLTIGLHPYGIYRWTVMAYNIKSKNFDRMGNITTATVSLTLQEYLRE